MWTSKVRRFVAADEVRERFVRYFVQRDHVLVPSSSLVPHGDPSLLFTNSGMVQFKDYFLARKAAPFGAAVSVQRCMRAGGKHNDLDNVGYTPRHHTYFEMLGNFSFGRYFKHEAITYAWDFLVKDLRLDPERLRVTVLHGDQEAHDIWHKIVGLPKERILFCGPADNFWSMGDGEGPCGPCSEIFWDLGEGVTASSDDRWLEIWNLVFMQNQRNADGSLQSLAVPCVDTGMGLERVTSVLQGKTNNYDIDSFSAITSEVLRLLRSCNVTKDSLPAEVTQRTPQVRIIADHFRACTFLMADRVLPGTTGRSYVLRRILRRAVNAARQLSVDVSRGPFLSGLMPTLLATLSKADHAFVAPQAELICRLIDKEEASFAGNLIKGLELLETQVHHKNVPGELAFTLHDTFGFPLDLTQLVAEQHGWTVDLAGANKLMDMQRERGRASWTAKQGADWLVKATAGWAAPPQQFIGYSFSSTGEVPARVQNVAIGPADAHGRLQVAVQMDQTPFYPRGGGQVADSGSIRGVDGQTWRLTDVQTVGSAGNVAVLVPSERGQTDETVMLSLPPGAIVLCQLDWPVRRATEAHHTATHLLHAALRSVLGKHVGQAGSSVDAARLRFDFTHGAPVNDEQLASIERSVQHAIDAQVDVVVQHEPLKSAMERGAMAMFNEKYPDIVRTVTVPGFSYELCGGTHVRNTGDLFPFKLLTESGISSGVRRVEAVAGRAAVTWLMSQQAVLSRTATMLKTAPAEVPKQVERLQEARQESKAKLDAAIAVLARVPVLGEVAQATVGDINTAIHFLPKDLDSRLMDARAEELRRSASHSVHILIQGNQVAVCVEPSVLPHHAGQLVTALKDAFGGKGGGQAAWARLRTNEPLTSNHVPQIVNALNKTLRAKM